MIYGTRCLAHDVTHYLHRFVRFVVMEMHYDAKSTSDTKNVSFVVSFIRQTPVMYVQLDNGHELIMF